MSADFKKYSGIIAVLVMNLGIMCSYSRLPQGYELASFSGLGVVSETRIIFTLTLVMSAVLTYIFLTRYVAKSFSIIGRFQLFSLVAAMAQITIALIPDDIERLFLVVIHWLAGLVLYLSIAGIMYLFAVNQSESLPLELQVKSVRNVVIAIFSVIVLSAVFLESFTIAQAMGAAAFFYWIIRVTFLKPTKQATVVNDNQ